LFQLAADDGRRELALRLELADRTSVSVVILLNRPFGVSDNPIRRYRTRPGAPRDRSMIVLTPQQIVEALPKQHHPRVEDKHAANENWLRAPNHGPQIQEMQLNRKRNLVAIMRRPIRVVNNSFARFAKISPIPVSAAPGGRDASSFLGKVPTRLIVC
jgi:hypothetical protein